MKQKKTDIEVIQIGEWDVLERHFLKHYVKCIIVWRHKTRLFFVTDYFINKAYNLYSDLCGMKQVHLNLSKIFGKMVNFLLLLCLFICEQLSFSLSEILNR